MNDPEFVQRLQVVVAAAAGLDNVDALLTKTKRELYVCKFRDTAIYLAREHTDLGWERLAEMFGARHHSALVNAYKREKMRLAHNPLRRDKRTYKEWHDFVLAEVQANATANVVARIEENA
jgi:chromosomal replication initiation ATPase DnaA